MQRQSRKPEDFYRHYPRTGDWGVRFLNSGLPLDEIKSFFTKFGTIKNVRQSEEGSTGYCFIHFESEEIARNCAVSTAKNESNFRLRPFPERNRQNEFPKCQADRTSVSSRWDIQDLDFSFKPRKNLSKQNSVSPEAIKELALEKVESEDQVVRSDKTSVSLQEIQDPIVNEDLTIVEKERMDTAGACSDTISELNTTMNTDSMGKSQPNTLDKVTASTSVTGSWTTSRYKEKLNSRRVPQILEDWSTIEAISTGPPPLKEANMMKEIPDLIEVEMLHCGCNEIPDLSFIALRNHVEDDVEKFPKTMAKIPDLIKASMDFEFPSNGFLSTVYGIYDDFMAEEVVVANFPELYEVNLILKIFQDHQPIYASDIKITPDKVLRYCYIYFRTRLEAETVQSLYDDVEIDGKKLIVMRVD